MTVTVANPTEHPGDDPAIQRLLKRMPANIASSFSTEQLFGLREAIGVRGGRLHSVDIRPTLKFPFIPWSFYLVFLVGRNRRAISQQEQYMAALLLLAFAISFVLGLSLMGLLVVYLLKSALGIDLFDGYSLGIWDWFKD
ncbi:hypothetical protein [Planctobacterium marinum]|uniref:3-phosphoshikimate 1-carboxyvinyltransferase n=1 Tax=Planctobacterium marinum TaxID=1631968 RepID=A0AA48HK14_9ALTE|nr:hypothetical protein MACH26_37790 [Planctobacterium marinum]